MELFYTDQLVWSCPQLHEAVAYCQNLIWLMDFTQMFPIYLNAFILTQIWMKLLSFAQIWLKLLDRTQMHLIYSNVSNIPQNFRSFLSGPNSIKIVGIRLLHDSSSLKDSICFVIRGKKWQK